MASQADRLPLLLERWRLLKQRRVILAHDGGVVAYWTPTEAAVRLETIAYLLAELERDDGKPAGETVTNE